MTTGSQPEMELLRFDRLLDCPIGRDFPFPCVAFHHVHPLPLARGSWNTHSNNAFWILSERSPSQRRRNKPRGRLHRLSSTSDLPLADQNLLQVRPLPRRGGRVPLQKPNCALNITTAYYYEFHRASDPLGQTNTLLSPSPTREVLHVCKYTSKQHAEECLNPTPHHDTSNGHLQQHHRLSTLIGELPKFSTFSHRTGTGAATPRIHHSLRPFAMGHDYGVRTYHPSKSKKRQRRPSRRVRAPSNNGGKTRSPGIVQEKRVPRRQQRDTPSQDPFPSSSQDSWQGVSEGTRLRRRMASLSSTGRMCRINGKQTYRIQH